MENYKKTEKLYLRALTKNQSNVFCQWSNNETIPHKHVDFYEFGLVSDGSYKNYCGHTISELTSHTLFLFDIGRTHRLKFNSAKARHFSICIEEQYFQILKQLFFKDYMIFSDEDINFRRLNDTEFNYMLLLANSLTSESISTEKIRSFFFNAIYLLTQLPVKQKTAYHQVVDDILEKMHNYTYLTCSVDEIYNYYSYSSTTLIKLFKQRTDSTIVNYQKQMRLECAARLMRETEYSIEKITQTIGLISTSYCFRIFKEYFGITPNEYRRNFRKSHENDLQTENTGGRYYE